MSSFDSRLPGALVISLDFELQWGVRERAGGPYAANLLGTHELVPRLLRLFEEYEIAATWATVGFLFASSREEREGYTPSVLPAYAKLELSPYGDATGEGERDDPLHFAPALIERIRETPRQEIATHTFSHYYCTEAGQTRESFAADLEAARAIAEARGLQLTSIVFPRNQHNPSYDEELISHGITAYRGNPDSWMWRFDDAADSATRGKRLARMLDTYVGAANEDCVPWSSVLRQSGLCDVRASRLLRPYSPSLRHLEGLRLRRIRRGLRAAARTGQIYHLWWHPHNLGINIDANLAFLRRILDEFARSRERFGMQSLSMAEVGALARAASGEVAANNPAASVERTVAIHADRISA